MQITDDRSIHWSLQIPISRCNRKRFSIIEPSPRQAAGNVLPDGRARQHRKDANSLDIRSLTPQRVTENALAYAVQKLRQTSLVGS